MFKKRSLRKKEEVEEEEIEGADEGNLPPTALTIEAKTKPKQQSNVRMGGPLLSFGLDDEEDEGSLSGVRITLSTCIYNVSHKLLFIFIIVYTGLERYLMLLKSS